MSAASGMKKSNKLTRYLNYRMRIMLTDTRVIVGKLMAFDKHMNLVLAETEEFRRVKSKDGEREEKRPLGMMILRGENVVSLTVEGAPPAAENRLRAKQLAAAEANNAMGGRGGPGAGQPAARGMPLNVTNAPGGSGAMPGLSGPAPGVGAPAAAAMAPVGASQGAAVAYGRGAPPPGMFPPGMPAPGGRGMPPPGMGMPPPGMPPMGMGPPPGFGGRGAPPPQ